MSEDNSVCQENNYQSIFKSQAGPLRNFLYYKCGDLEKAEDLMQDAFIKLWENCKKVILEKARSFLFTTAKRMFLNTIEHEKVVLSFAKENVNNSLSEDPQYIMEEQEFKTKLEDSISNLPATQREVFLLNRVDKLSFQEIADLQEVSLSAVHKKMYKAMDKLKNDLDILNHRKI
ncbi:RNA polymerase sigma factor [Fulvivirga lutimaris]|uniref:RNA polymerase sigma factor n=1 Tax=Fulvivirga lutimaris TaxID=1819566 RepID=UPI0012BD5C4D|nr:RNA polymerase sigma factor [Fulvivirga lutimaris]MTI40347.1 RNA polymerase sigma factor [Fulvivirga lutimaris]